MLRRLAGSTVLRLVVAIFILQLVSGGAAIALLRSQMLHVIEGYRTRELVDTRDDLLEAYYSSGQQGLVRVVTQGQGSLSDQQLLVVATIPGRPPIRSHVASVPDVPAGQLVHRTVLPGPGLPLAEALLSGTELADGTRLVVGSYAAPDTRFDLAFAEALALVVILTALLALVGALLIGYAVSLRAHAIAMTAEELASGNFAARLSAGERGDGFDHLRKQMNLMAERIDQLIGELQTVAGTLAHDLRSPVARIRAAIEAAQATVTGQGAAESLQLALADAEALERMLNAALELTRLESGNVPDRRLALDMANVVEDLVELYEPLAEQRGIMLEAAVAPAPFRGDRELISRALANLIDNALKHGGPHIRVRTFVSNGEVVLEVEDDGPGIDPALRERALTRFGRLDNARTRPGVGLGLAMVAAVARFHGGMFELRGAGGATGLVASMRLAATRTVRPD